MMKSNFLALKLKKMHNMTTTGLFQESSLASLQHSERIAPQEEELFFPHSALT